MRKYTIQLNHLTESDKKFIEKNFAEPNLCLTVYEVACRQFPEETEITGTLLQLARKLKYFGTSQIERVLHEFLRIGIVTLH